MIEVLRAQTFLKPCKRQSFSITQHVIDVHCKETENNYEHIFYLCKQRRKRMAPRGFAFQNQRFSVSKYSAVHNHVQYNKGPKN